MKSLEIKNTIYEVVEKSSHYHVFVNGHQVGNISKERVVGTKVIDVLRAYSGTRIKGCNHRGVGLSRFKGVFNEEYGTENLEANKANRWRS